jgi:hypothetical protein
MNKSRAEIGATSLAIAQEEAALRELIIDHTQVCSGSGQVCAVAILHFGCRPRYGLIFSEFHINTGFRFVELYGAVYWQNADFNPV